MELETVLPRGNPHFPHEVIGLVEGTDTIFINVSAGLFTLDLKSRKLKKIGKREDCFWIKPYMSFYTPGISLCAFFKKKNNVHVPHLWICEIRRPQVYKNQVSHFFKGTSSLK